MNINRPSSSGYTVLPALKDSSMAAAIQQLDSQKGNVSGQAMMNTIVNGAKDHDNQAAGLEFAELQKWVGNNQARLSPEAKQVFAAYEKAARASLAQGKTGIADADFKKLTAEMQKLATPPAPTPTPAKPTTKPAPSKFEPLPTPVKSDASASQATGELKAKPGQISGNDMADAIAKGVSDLDGQAAGAEFNEFQKFAKENGAKLSPEAKEVMGIYEKYAKAAQAKGQTGIDQGEFSKMLTEMRNVKDSSATKALAELDKKAGTITGDEMARAIQKGTADLDGQAAGAEYDAFKNWAQANQAKLSPEAKQVMELYKQHAEGAKAKGGSGIPLDEWKSMIKDMKNVGDLSAKQALAELDKKAANGTISGDDLAAAIDKGTADLDGQAAGKEFAEFEKWAKANQAKLSPEAKEVMKLYREAVADAKAKGQTGIPAEQMKTLLEKMKNVGDVGAKKALAALDQKTANGTVSGDDMARAIQKGTADLDGQSANKELAEFEKWAKANESRLSPEAKEVLDLYRKAAGEAKAKGQTGISQDDWNKLVKDMKSVGDVSAKKALAELDQKTGATGTVSGEDLAAAIDKGTSDADNQAAGKEFAAFEKWAKANESRLSPEAKEVMDLYRKAAAEAKAKGQTGIPQDQMKALLEKMKNVGDVSAKKALAELDQKTGATGTVSGDDLAAAIDKGTADADNQAAGKEFEAFEKWAKANESRLSPEAKEVMDLYRKAAAEAKAKGQTGIPQDQMKALLEKMKNVGDVSAKKALAELDQKTGVNGTVSGDDLLRAIKQGTADLDGQAAGKEFAEFEKWAKANEGKLSPEAKEVLGIYKKYADQAKANGQTGISEADSKKMFREMRNVGDVSAKAALAELGKKFGPVSGEDLAKAIKDGISDLDGNSTTKELKEFQKWAKANPEKLTPEAKQVLETYEKYAKAAGKNGISQADSEKMFAEMAQFKTYSDDTTRAAIDTLNTKAGPVSGADLTKAITQGTADLDGQAAGLERADFAKWAGMNQDRLSPEAKQVLAIYERYANRSLAAGQTGIPQDQWKKMIEEMNNVGKDRFKAFIAG